MLLRKLIQKNNHFLEFIIVTYFVVRCQTALTDKTTFTGLQNIVLVTAVIYFDDKVPQIA